MQLQRDVIAPKICLEASFGHCYPRGFLGFPHTRAICPLQGGHLDIYRRLQTSLWGPILWGSANTAKASVTRLPVMS